MSLFKEYIAHMKERFVYGEVQAMNSERIKGLAEVTEKRLAAIEEKLSTRSKDQPSPPEREVK